jgi:hypothetical protein
VAAVPADAGATDVGHGVGEARGDRRVDHVATRGQDFDAGHGGGGMLRRDDAAFGLRRWVAGERDSDQAGRGCHR